MKIVPLTDAELAIVIDDSGDKIFLEIIKGMSHEELREFDVYCPKNLKHYNTIQTEWIKTERYLIEHRGGNWHDVSEIELIDDMTNHRNGERFRVFYVLKYPALVKRIH